MNKNTSTDEKQLGLKWEHGNVPYSETYGDYFYSSNNGCDECRHVFIDGNNLTERLSASQDFMIAELGFGTGLNFLETWNFWQNIRKPGQSLNFVSFERHPLDLNSMKRGLEQWNALKKLSDVLLKFWAERNALPEIWQIDDQTTLQVCVGNAINGVSKWNGRADAWYLDGFSPSKNPDMWSGELMQSVFEHTNPFGTFATYTSAGWVRRNLADAGFEVQRVPGHGKKRHMSIGIKKI